MRRILKLVCLSVALAASAGVAFAQSEEKEATPLIQLAILLDTSNSMDGLIDQAKAQLWKIVNEFIAAKRDGKTPEFLVALYEYGNDNIPVSAGHIRMVVPLTTDLDEVSEKLFALTTRGGDEFCGKVIKTAAGELNWSKSDEDYKAIFIAGNEPFTQGDVDYTEGCKAAIEKGITVNTIFCGSHDKGVSTKWKDGALLADGMYLSIDQNQKVVHIDAPQDKEIAELGTKLNETYIPYGSQGKANLERQAAQDSNAQSSSSGSNVQRQVCKASSNYRNASWDLVDAVKEGNVKIEEIKDEDLPENMRKMSVEERKAYVETQAKERERIQNQITKLNEERQKYVAEKTKELSQSGKETLDSAMTKAIQEQAQKKNFQLAEESAK